MRIILASETLHPDGIDEWSFERDPGGVNL